VSLSVFVSKAEKIARLEQNRRDFLAAKTTAGFMSDAKDAE
jgi:hypothetical protein